MGFESETSIEYKGTDFFIGKTIRGPELQPVINFSFGPHTSEVELNVVKQKYRILSTITEHDIDQKDMKMYLDKLAVAINQELQKRFKQLSEDFQ